MVYGRQQYRHSWIAERLARVLMVCFAVLAGPVLAAGQGYSFGVLPYLVPKTIAEIYGPAAVDIAAKLDKPVVLKTASSFDRYREKLKQQSYDIAVIQPFDYPLVVEELGYIPLAQVKVQLRAVVIVKQQTPYTTLEDLKGKRIALAPRHAATSRQGMWALKEAGLLMEGGVNLNFLGSHDACLHALLVDNADACITGPPPYKDFVGRTGARLRVLTQTSPIPHILAVAHPRVPEADRSAIVRTMSGWVESEQGRAVLAKMRFPAWIPAQPAQYAVMKRYLELETVQPAEGVQREDLLFGSFPYFHPRVLAKQFATMTRGFSASTGRPVHFRTTPSFERFRGNLGQGKYDIALIRPHDYGPAMRGGYAPLARLAPDLDASIFVRKDSELHTLADLQGRTVAFAPLTAILTRLGQDYLKQQQVSVEVLYRSGHDACLESVIKGEASACVTSPILAKALGDEVFGQLRVVAETHKSPNVLFVMHKRHSASLRQRVAQQIIGWANTDAGKIIKKDSGLGPFVEVNVRDYEGLKP